MDKKDREKTHTKGIPPLELPLDKEVQELMDWIFPKEIPSPNLYRILAKNPSLFRDLIESRFIGPTGVFDKKRLDPRTRELLILRTCRANNNRYEYALHRMTISQKMGLLPEQITDIWNHSPDPGLWNDRDLSLFELVDRLTAREDTPASLHGRLSGHFSESELIDIVLLIGFYTSVSMLVAFSRPTFDHYNG
ncbi:carboxymuconolactone decarboxylase family protein [Muricauda sp. NFXS6]|uniref:carboxymuconolactone decarboxylase family protein n=1 Tax=Allomuricauda sp. NFXS6 TaxID=2819094 RepID=UPI0032DEBD67